MNNIQINKSRMYQTVNKVLESNRQMYAGIEELGAAQGQLTNYLELIGSYRQVQELNQTGLTGNKMMLKERLTNQLLKLVAGLSAYATVTRNTVLLAKVFYKPYALQKPDPVLADIARLILNEAKSYQNELTRFFVTQADLTELETLVTQFMEAIPQKRVATNYSKVSTLNIAAVFAASDKLLKNETDMLMLPFRFTQPDFYEAYKNARIIVKYSGRKKTQEGPVPAEAQS